MPRKTRVERRADAKSLRIRLLQRWGAAYRSGSPVMLDAAKVDYWLAVALQRRFCDL